MKIVDICRLLCGQHLVTGEKILLFWIKSLRAAPVSLILQEYTTLWHFLHLRFLLPEKVKRFLFLPSKSDPFPFVILNAEPLNQLQDDSQRGDSWQY